MPGTERNYGIDINSEEVRPSDLYELLGVRRDANQDELDEAKRNKAKKFHPDVNPNAKIVFSWITEAHFILSDPQRRSEYDADNPPTPPLIRIVRPNKRYTPPTYNPPGRRVVARETIIVGVR